MQSHLFTDNNISKPDSRYDDVQHALTTLNNFQDPFESYYFDIHQK